MDLLDISHPAMLLMSTTVMHPLTDDELFFLSPWCMRDLRVSYIQQVYESTTKSYFFDEPLVLIICNRDLMRFRHQKLYMTPTDNYFLDDLLLCRHFSRFRIRYHLLLSSKFSSLKLVRGYGRRKLSCVVLCSGFQRM